jgi:hypothetical protein
MLRKATREDAIYDDSDKKIIWKDSDSPREVDGVYKVKETGMIGRFEVKLPSRCITVETLVFVF